MVYTIGETVLDIIFKNIDDVKVKPGGSMLNTAISLGRLGVDVAHVSTLSTDKASDLLIKFLETNHVSAKFTFRSKKIKTNLALAYLNSDNNAEYTFYKDDLNLKDSLSLPNLNNGDIVHFGSFFSINRNVHNQLQSFLVKAKAIGAITLYDPNFRKPHLPMLQLLMPLIDKNIETADIVKGSDEDFKNIYNLNSGKEVWELIKLKGVKVLFYTKGKKGSEVFTKEGAISVEPNPVEAISTIGAGDTFSAGIIYYLTKKALVNNIDGVSLNQWQKCIQLASKFAAETCLSLDNYLSDNYCKVIKNV